MLHHALALHALGFNVIPLRYDNPEERKRPLGSWARWSTERQIRGWLEESWRRHPEAGIAIVTGAVSGVVVVDCDSAEALEWANRNLPPTPVRVRTGKGEHRFYRHPGEPVRNRAKLEGMGLDVRGDGGYVVAPPSLHPTGAVYAWIGGIPLTLEHLPTFVPAWLARPDAQQDLAPAPVSATRSPPVGAAHVNVPPPGVHDLTLRRAQAWMARRDPAVQGHGGDQHTFTTACQLVRDFGLDEATAWPLMEAWNATCVPPWSAADLRAKLRSALRSGSAVVGSKPDRDPGRSQGAENLIAEARAWSQESRPGPATPPPVAAAAVKASKGKASKDKVVGAGPGPAPDNDPRPIVYVEDDPRRVYLATLQELAWHPGVYASGGQIARVGDGQRVQGIGAGGVARALVDRVRFVKVTGGEARAIPPPDYLIRMLLELPPEDSQAFRVLEQVTGTPYWTASAQPVTEPGYNPESRTLLAAPPMVEDGQWPNSAAALQWICDEVLGDFPFASPGERANYLGALLVPIVRRMIDGPVPMHNIEASRRGTGKSLLAQLLLAVHGLPLEMSSLPSDEAELEKRALAILRDGRTVQVWDNVKHYVNSPTLDILLTSRVYTGRLLQQSLSLSYPIQLLPLMTSNNARVDEDLARRIVRIRMVSREEFPEDRREFKHLDVVAWVQANRPKVLSALWQAVAEWVRDGKPEPGKHLRLGSYEAFVRVVGGVLWHAGVWDWLDNLKAAREEQSADADEWAPFLEAWWQRNPGYFVGAKALYDMADSLGLMLEARGPGMENAQIQRLARAVRSQRDAVRCGYVIEIGKDSHTKAMMFKLLRATPSGANLPF
jgi:hypothetical protein